MLHVVFVADDVRNGNYDGGLVDWYDLVDGRNFERGNGDIQYWNEGDGDYGQWRPCLLYTSPSPRDRQKSRMPSSA